MIRGKKQRLSKKVTRARQKQAARFEDKGIETPVQIEKKDLLPVELKKISLPKIIQVRRLAEVTGLAVGKLISILMKNGISANLNESIDFETAAIILTELGFEAEIQTAKKVEGKVASDSKNLKLRTPVIAVVGHVDHGKTKLLDAIRKTDVVAGESGGITQHITAWSIKYKKRELTFMDTPGHEAFTTMRAHGVNITDITILVVAADDGVMPQTKEAISHIKAAETPVIVAINKIDKPEANVEKVKRQLADEGLSPEEWGGKVPMVEISAKENLNINKLLDMVILVADVTEIKADFERPVYGIVIEARKEVGVGPVAVVLVQEGVLEIGNCLIIGDIVARVRLLRDAFGKKIEKALPGEPVVVSGLQKMAKFGNFFELALNEKEAQKIIVERQLESQTNRGITKTLKKGDTVNLILKADTTGSLAALANSLEDLKLNDIAIKIVHLGVGAISESDVNLALATNALILSFKAPAGSQVKKLADNRKVLIFEFDIIYDLIDKVKEILESRQIIEKKEIVFGKIKILKVFYQKNDLIICGGMVLDGKLLKNNYLRRAEDSSGAKKEKTKIIDVQVNKMPATEAVAGSECGLKIEGTFKPEVGEVLVCVSGGGKPRI